MRVIAGIARGRPLRATRSPEMRPTTDMMRRTIFDILGATTSDADVLDLFAGAGTLGIEAVSRGARSCVFVDHDRDACRVIASNLESTKLASEATVVKRADVVRFLNGPATAFDLVFLDPPYGRGLGFVTRIVGQIAAGPWLRRGGTVVVEAERGQLDWPPGFRETRTRVFGQSQVSMAVRDAERADGDLPGDV